LSAASYYDRDQNVIHIDGTRIFQTKEDRAAEAEVATILGKRWNCELHPFGALSPIDWYAARNGRLSALVELKRRSHPSTQFPTVFLNVRKWLALQLGSIGIGVPPIFVVQFQDGIFWISVHNVDASNQRIGGCSRRVKAASDIEPVIEIPIASLRAL
jgi:hypothetical protein